MKLTALFAALAFIPSLGTAHANDKSCPAIDGYNIIYCDKSDKIFPVIEHTTKLGGYANQQGKIVITPQFDIVFPFFNENIAKVSIKDKWGMIDTQGNIVIPIDYDYLLLDSTTGYISARKGDKLGLLDKQGNILIDFIYDGQMIDNKEVFLVFSDGAAWAKQNGKMGFIDTTGKEIIPFIYDEFDTRFIYSLRYIGAKKNGKWGFIDHTGKAVIDFIYDSADLFYDDKVKVTLNGETFYIDETGTRIK